MITPFIINQHSALTINSKGSQAAEGQTLKKCTKTIVWVKLHKEYVLTHVVSAGGAGVSGVALAAGALMCRQAWAVAAARGAEAGVGVVPTWQ